jgi:hypothetical protein
LCSGFSVVRETSREGRLSLAGSEHNEHGAFDMPENEIPHYTAPPNQFPDVAASPMTPPVERAAEAIVDELRRQEPEHGGTYFIDAAHLDDTVIDGRFDLYAIARAVLAAIREPSEGMRQAGESIGDEECIPTNDGYAQLSADGETKIWQAMIDAMLAEGE